VGIAGARIAKVMNVREASFLLLVSAIPALATLSASASGIMSDADFAAKREGRYVTGLPLVNYSSDTGFGYGARIYLFNNGSRNDPAFRETPYESQLFVQYFATTGGWQYHYLDADFPRIAGSAFRARGWLAYEKNTSRNFYGIGEASLHGFPGTTYAGYQKSLDNGKPLGSGDRKSVV
jgi:hypothetical protein